MMEMIKYIISALLISVGLLFMIFATFGTYRYKYVLNRMHSAAIGDTLGILFCLLGLIVVMGFSVTSLKLILVIICLWLTSPVASHLISRLEVTTNEDAERKLEIIDLDSEENKKEGE